MSAINYINAHATLAAQITVSVRWYDTMEYSQPGENTFEEIGPGQVLTGLMKRICQAQPV